MNIGDNMLDKMSNSQQEVYDKLNEYSQIIHNKVLLDQTQIADLERYLKYCKIQEIQKNEVVINAIDCCLYLECQVSDKNYYKVALELAMALYQNSRLNNDLLEVSVKKYIDARTEYLGLEAKESKPSPDPGLCEVDLQLSSFAIANNTQQIRLDHLPYELVYYALSMYPEESVHVCSALALTCRQLYDFIQPQRLLQKLLLHVAWGKQDSAEEILKIRPDLLLARGTVIDHAGRKFVNITAFELAVWNLDTKYMCGMMLKCIPENDLGKKIKSDLRKQLESIEAKDVNYLLNNENPSEPYYNFDNLINSLKRYVKYVYNRAITDAQLDDYWYKIVGGAQRNAPMHILQHYCDPDFAFEPTPSFNNESFNRSGSIYSKVHKTIVFRVTMSAFAPGMGETFALSRCNEKNAIGPRVEKVIVSGLETGAIIGVRRMLPLSKDVLALEKLYEARIKNLTYLKLQLSSEVAYYDDVDDLVKTDYAKDHQQSLLY